MKFDTHRTTGIRATGRDLKHLLLRLHRDDRGAEALEKLLIVAVVVLPLLGALIFFRDEINSWVGGEWDDVVRDGGDDLPTPNPAPGP
jgi:Flp pilus assembly pilin Flp